MQKRLLLIGTLDTERLFSWIIALKKSEKYGSIGDLLKSIKSLIVAILFQKGNFRIDHKNTKSKILFCIADENVRKDTLFMMNNVAGTLEHDELYDFICWQPHIKFSISRFVSNMLLLPIFFFQLRKMNVNMALRNLLLISLYEIKDRKKELDYVANKRYTLCVVNYDACTFGNFIVQYFRSTGAKTVTLQHGIMLAPRKGLESNPDFLGIEFKCSISDYFLAWNDFSKQEAIKSGMNPEKIHVLGQCKRFYSKKDLRMVETRKIAVFLDGKFTQDNNVQILTIVKKFSKNYGYNYSVRLHPNFNGHEYDGYIGEKGSVCKQGITVDDFLNDIEFCVVANSGILFELEDMGIPFLRYTSKSISDKFLDYNSPSFNSYEEFVDLFRTKKHISWITNIVRNDSMINYHDFFFNLIN